MAEEVRILAARHEGASETLGDGQWALSGFDLRSALARVCEVPDGRVGLPSGLDTADRYDFILTMPPGEAHDARNRLMRAGIEAHFGVRIADETRLVDVYVMTAPNGAGPDLKYVDRHGMAMASWSIVTAVQEKRFSLFHTRREAAPAAADLNAVGDLNACGISIDGLCRMLEMHLLGRPVVNETQLSGCFDFKIDQIAPGTNALLLRLRDRAGLVLTPAIRDVTVITVQERQHPRT